MIDVAMILFTIINIGLVSLFIYNKRDEEDYISEANPLREYDKIKEAVEYKIQETVEDKIASLQSQYNIKATVILLDTASWKIVVENSKDDNYLTSWLGCVLALVATDEIFIEVA